MHYLKNQVFAYIEAINESRAWPEEGFLQTLLMGMISPSEFQQALHYATRLHKTRR